MRLKFNVKDELFDDFDYQQETHANVNRSNSETNPGPVSETFKQILKNERDLNNRNGFLQEDHLLQESYDYGSTQSVEHIL
jgi:hypothetical protein